MRSDIYGKPITKEQADVFFDRFRNIKKRSVEKIKKALEGDEEAIRYYCGRHGDSFIPENEDWAYIFDKRSLGKTLQKILAGEADGMIIFHGVRSEKDSPYDDNGKPTDSDGRPTLMLFPIQYKQAIADGDTEFILLGEDGEEHPGTGGGTNDGPPLGSLGLPPSIRPGGHHGIR